jgi:hypothetical protein
MSNRQAQTKPRGQIDRTAATMKIPDRMVKGDVAVVTPALAQNSDFAQRTARFDRRTRRVRGTANWPSPADLIRLDPTTIASSQENETRT